MRKKEVRGQKSEARSSSRENRKLVYSNSCILTPIFFFLLAIGCQAQRSTKPYYEDLSSLRPKVKFEAEATVDSVKIRKTVSPIPVQYAVNKKVDAVLDSIDRFNLTRKFVDGFTIQIFSGQKRDEALNANKRMAELVPDLKANVQYQQPKFRVTVGKYFTRLEAQKDLYRLKRIFTNAILVPERIMIK